MPIMLMKDVKLIKKLVEIGQDHLKELERAAQERSQNINLQTLHRAFETKLIQEIRKHSKSLKLKILSNIKALESNRMKILNDQALSKDKKSVESAILDERIRNLEALRFARA